MTDSSFFIHVTPQSSNNVQIYNQPECKLTQINKIFNSQAVIKSNFSAFVSQQSTQLNSSFKKVYEILYDNLLFLLNKLGFPVSFLLSSSEKIRRQANGEQYYNQLMALQKDIGITLSEKQLSLHCEALARLNCFEENSRSKFKLDLSKLRLEALPQYISLGQFLPNFKHCAINYKLNHNLVILYQQNNCAEFDSQGNLATMDAKGQPIKLNISCNLTQIDLTGNNLKKLPKWIYLFNCNILVDKGQAPKSNENNGGPLFIEM